MDIDSVEKQIIGEVQNNLNNKFRLDVNVNEFITKEMKEVLYNKYPDDYDNWEWDEIRTLLDRMLCNTFIVLARSDEEISIVSSLYGDENSIS